VGAGNSAGQAAIHLARFASRVTMIVRGQSLAASMSDYLIRQIGALPNIDVRLGTWVVDGHGDRRLEAVTVERVDGKREKLCAAGLFVLVGARPILSGSRAPPRWMPRDTPDRPRLAPLRPSAQRVEARARAFFSWRRACRECSLSATRAAAPSSASHLQWERAPRRSSLSTSTCAQHDRLNKYRFRSAIASKTLNRVSLSRRKRS